VLPTSCLFLLLPFCLNLLPFPFCLQQDEEHKRLSKKSKKKGGKQKIKEDFLDDFSDENFAYIAGYTSGGVPFGLTHEEAGNIFEEE